jgi:hypothetical protein
MTSNSRSIDSPARGCLTGQARAKYGPIPRNTAFSLTGRPLSGLKWRIWPEQEIGFELPVIWIKLVGSVKQATGYTPLERGSVWRLASNLSAHI